MDDARIVGNLRLWSWLGMFYFDAVVRKDGIGYLRLDKSDTQFAIDPNDQGRGVHRHQLTLAYEIYVWHPNDAWLTDPPVRKGGTARNALTETIRLAQTPIIHKTSVLMLPNRLETVRRRQGRSRRCAPADADSAAKDIGKLSV